MKPDEIKSQDDLKKYLAETEATHAISKAEVDKKAAESEAELKALKEEMKVSRDKLAEVTSHNWVEKFSTQHVKEETLYNFGKYIKGVRNGDRELLNKYGGGGHRLSAAEENQFSVGEYNVTPKTDGIFHAPSLKADLGTPLYSDATTGSYLVPVQYSGEVAYVAKQSSQMMGQVRELPMSTRTLLFPIQDASASWKWNVAQTSANTEVNPTFSQGTLTSYTGAIWTGVVDEMNEDSLVPLAAYYRDIFGQAWGYEFDYQTTQSNANPFTGMLSGAGNVFTLAAGQTSFDSMAWADGYTVVQQLTTENKRIGAKFVMHATVLDNLRKLVDAQGRPIWCMDLAGGGLIASQTGMGAMSGKGTLWGYPVLTTDGMVPNSSSAVGTKFMIFGNPQYFYYGNRVGMEFRVFDQTAYSLEYNQVFFRMRLRAAFTTAVTGAFVAVKTAAA